MSKTAESLWGIVYVPVTYQLKESIDQLVWKSSEIKNLYKYSSFCWITKTVNAIWLHINELANISVFAQVWVVEPDAFYIYQMTITATFEQLR